MAHGVPTCIANISSLPELCGDAAVPLAQLSAAAIADALEPVLRDPERSRKLAEAGRTRAATFSWHAAAEGHLRAYRVAMA